MNDDELKQFREREARGMQNMNKYRVEEFPDMNQGRMRHGSPLFYDLLQEMAETHDKKSHDYASNSDPFGNYHFAGLVAGMFSHSPQDAGFAGRIAEKLYRLANLEKHGKTPKNEGLEDTERDIAVIVTLWMADRRHRRFIEQVRNNPIGPSGGRKFQEGSD